jgi:hypothetical protein
MGFDVKSPGMDNKQTLSMIKSILSENNYTGITREFVKGALFIQLSLIPLSGYLLCSEQQKHCTLTKTPIMDKKTRLLHSTTTL